MQTEGKTTPGKIILVRCGEIMLKGLNKPDFENRLISNIKLALHGLGGIKVLKSQSRIYIEPEDSNYDFDAASERLKKVFGIVSFSIAEKVLSDFDVIKKCSLDMLTGLTAGMDCVTFKVETKRGDKRFPETSPEISASLGEYLLDHIPNLKVDVHSPDFTLYIEVREYTYIYSVIRPGSGGMPSGTNGKALLLLSGGIDSPVAGWMTAKRGVEIEAVHFYSYPYTSEKSRQKVIALTEILAGYTFNIRLYIVPFTDIQLALREKCPEDHITVIMRRAMYKIAEKIAVNTGALALVTGESIGQVASQTMQAIYVTDEAAGMPVFRPLIGMDKNDVVRIAREIGTFETSILPYEDCCTVFVAKHPKTKPLLSRVRIYEEKAGIEELLEKAVHSVEVINIHARQNYQ